MLDRVPSSTEIEVQDGAARSPPREAITLAEILLFLRRYAGTIAATTVLFLLFATYTAVTSKSLYTAAAQVLIDPRISQIQREQIGEVPLLLDSAQIESQLALLRSEQISRTVIEQLGLTEDPEFQSKPPGLVARTLARFRLAPPAPAADDRLRTAVLAFQAALDVVRVGVSYGIHISFSSESPEKAARIVNAIASIYVRDQLEVRSQAVNAGSLWLEEKINFIRRKMNSAARATQEFKASHDYRLRAPPSPGEASRAKAEVGPRLGEGTAPGTTLEELESTALAYRKLYESYLLAHTEILQRDSYPVSNARVISKAMVPASRSHPRTQLILSFSLLSGLLAGLGIALVQHCTDHRLSSPRQLRTETGLHCFGQLPRLPEHRACLWRRASQWWIGMVGHGASASHSAADTIADTINLHLTPEYASAIRSVRTNLMVVARRRPLRTIGLVSAGDGSHRPTAAAALALMYARSGVRALLLDGDFRDARLTATLAHTATQGWLEVLDGTTGASDAICSDTPLEGVDILPFFKSGSQDADAGDLMGAESMRGLLDDLGQTYGIIIADLPSLTAVPQASSLAALLDGLLLAVRWNITPAPVAVETARNLQSAHAHILGAILTDVVPDRLRPDQD